MVLVSMASPHAVADLKAMLTAKSAKQFESAERRYQMELTAKNACEWEKSTGKIPANCYLFAANLSYQKMRKLDSQCNKASMIEDSMEILREKLKLPGLSKECKSSMSRQLRILLYQLGAEI